MKLTLLLVLCLSGCIHPKIRYNKQYLLDPILDPAQSNMGTGMIGEPTGGEKGNVNGSGGAGASCPTCSS